MNCKTVSLIKNGDVVAKDGYILEKKVDMYDFKKIKKTVDRFLVNLNAEYKELLENINPDVFEYPNFDKCQELNVIVNDNSMSAVAYLSYVCALMHIDLAFIYVDSGHVYAQNCLPKLQKTWSGKPFLKK